MKVPRMHWVQVRLQTLSPGYQSRWQELLRRNLPEAPRIPWPPNHLVGQEHRKSSRGQLDRSLKPLVLKIGWGREWQTLERRPYLGHQKPAHSAVHRSLGLRMWKQEQMLAGTEKQVVEELRNRNLRYRR